MSPATAATSVRSPNSRATTSRSPIWRASMTSDQPRSARARARARPSPLEAPVMSASGMHRPYAAAGPALQRQLVLRPFADETIPYRKERRLRAVGDAELGEQMPNVGLHRLLGDAEF